MPFKSSGRGAYGPQGQKVIKGPLAPVWTTFNPPDYSGTGAYSYQFVATDDSGDAPTYSLASGSVPTGLTLSSSGLLSGTPTASGTFTFNVRATDVNGRFTDSGNVDIIVSLSIYTFTSATFTTNGEGGQGGSAVSAGRASIGNPTWANTYLNNGSYTGWWSWTVPSTATYRIACAGSRGQNSPERAGGNGAVITGDIALTQGEVLQLSIGKYYSTVTSSASYSGGGGGGTFVYRNNTGIPIIVAGGGGGGGGNWNGNTSHTTGSPGSTATNGVSNPPNTSWTTADNTSASAGSGGYSGTGGGLAYNGVAGGGGWSGDGQDGNNTSQGGRRLSTGGVGGNATNDGSNPGGFGGGGGGRNVAGAGGGGYTGGNGASWDSAPNPGGGGGGGSWIGSGVSFVSAAQTNSGLGYITITKL